MAISLLVNNVSDEFYHKKLLLFCVFVCGSVCGFGSDSDGNLRNFFISVSANHHLNPLVTNCANVCVKVARSVLIL